ncbi:MAG TPA: S9 family peptidase [Thermoanaerobaculia bacterium]|jgi:dipeptidyl aminopeptidase/acylaminoacyl peptidase|nr:S9 family peptidase [Thermoanaerobaculia bacterium]
MDRRSLPVFLLLLALPALVLAAKAPAAPADALTASVERMAKVSSSFAPSPSPDGKRVAFLSNRGGLPQVWIAEVDKATLPKQVGAFEDPVSSVEWSPDGKWLALLVAPGGGLNQQVYLMHPDGSGVQRITGGGKENNTLAGWSGKLLRYSSGRDNPDSLDPWIYDSETGKSRKVASGGGISSLADVSRDGKRAVISRLVSRGDDNLYLIDLATGKETLLTPHDPPGSFGGGWLSPDGSTVYLSSNRDADKTFFARARLGPDGQPLSSQKLGTRDDAEVDDFALAPDASNAFVVFNAAGRDDLAFINLKEERAELQPLRMAGDILGGLNYSENGKRLVLTVGGANRPTDIWVIEVATRSARQLTRSPHEGVDLEKLKTPQLVHFPAHDGLDLSGWLYRPRGEGPGPVVISFHGGPEGQERPSFNSTYQALMSRGIGVFAPNVRGSSGFGKKFVNLDNGELRVEGVKDIKDCVDYLVKARIADPKRIGIMGGSYGGYMTLAGLTEFPDLFAAGADLFGIVNFETFFAQTEPWMAAISTKEYGDPVTQKDLLYRLSPIHKLDKVKAPLLVLHGANDTNVPLVEAKQVAEELKKRGVPVESVIFPDEGHGFRKTPNRVRSTVEIVRWFDKYLKP